MFFFWFFLLPLAALSIIEIWLVLTLGPILGTGWTIAWMAGSFLLGIVLLRVEGMLKLVRIHRMLLAEEVPTAELLDLVFVLFGAAMLILPGFLTDFIGLSFLTPPVRWGLRGLVRAGLRRLAPDVRGSSGPVQPSAEVIEIFPDKDAP